MASPEQSSGGVLVALLQACPACDAPVYGNSIVCPQCEADRPDTGWLAVDPGIGTTLTDEMEDDPDTATSAPPPVVPADIAPAPAPVRPAPAAAASTSMAQFYVRFFGIFAATTVLTAAVVTLVGMQFLPNEGPRRPITTIAPVVTPAVGLGVPVDPLLMPMPSGPGDVVPEPAEGTDDPVPVVMAAPVPVAVAPVPIAPAPVVQVEPSPVGADGVDDADTSAAVVVPEPVVLPSVPEAARALNGTYIGKSDGAPMSMELTFGPDRRLTALLRMSGRSGTEVHRVAGTYTLAPDGSADFALSDRTDDGVVGYSGTVSGSAAGGIVTADGRRRGRFAVER